MLEQISTLTTEFPNEREEQIFQTPSSEDRVKIAGKIAIGSDEDPTGPQCPGSQCYSACSRC